METLIEKKALLNSASISGLALGGVCVAYSAIIYALGKIELSPMLVSLFSTILWAAKFAACILLMRYFMQRLVKSNPGIDGRITRRQGILSAFFSALITAGATLFQILFIITPEAYASEMMSAMGQMYGMLDSNSMKAIQDMLPNMPVISFFSTLVYCFIYGCILAAILSRFVPKQDPFAEYHKTEETE